VLLRGLRARYVLVGDDFSFGAKRAGNYAMLDAAGSAHGFDVARMLSYEVHGLRVSSSAVREALAAGDMAQVQVLLGRPYSISGHVLHGRKLGRDLGYRTLNLRFAHRRPAAHGIFAVRVRGLSTKPCPAWPASVCGPRWKQPGRCCWKCTAWIGRAHWARTAATAAACRWTAAQAARREALRHAGRTAGRHRRRWPQAQQWLARQA
jgi:hypothetical protein